MTDVVLLGMGGSSLASLVLSSVLGESGDATLHVLDTTAPRTIDAALATLDPATTLYVVASKSGGTIEPNSLYAIFREVADQALGREEAGRRFIAITDPGSSLETLAADGRLPHDRVLAADRRRALLGAVGLRPRACGADRTRRRRLARTGTRNGDGVRAARRREPRRPARRVRRRRRIRRVATSSPCVASPPLASFGLWVEQLVAESLGKEGRGVVPVVELSDDRPQGYGSDRAVVVVRLEGDERLAEWAGQLAADDTGHRTRAPRRVRRRR